MNRSRTVMKINIECGSRHVDATMTFESKEDAEKLLEKICGDILDSFDELKDKNPGVRYFEMGWNVEKEEEDLDVVQKKED